MPEPNEKCLNCNDHFEQLAKSIAEIRVSKHFLRDLPDFNTELITDSRNEHFTMLHKFEENIEGNHIFRAVHNEKHIVYAIDKKHRLIFLRAFHNFKEYKKFLNEKKEILRMIEQN
jgi:hypothetical protein